MRNLLKTFLIVLFGLGLASCATGTKGLTLHDEVLIYALPYDLTYLRTLDALNLQDGWELAQTEKEKGIIRVQNTQYSRFDDSDKRSLTFLVKRVDRDHTSVSLAPESQRILSGGDILKAVGKQLSSEVK